MKLNTTPINLYEEALKLALSDKIVETKTRKEKDDDFESNDVDTASRLAKKKKKAEEQPVEEAAPSAGLTKKEKSEIVKKAKAGKDLGKAGKGFEKVEKAAKKSGAKDPKAVAAAAMWKQQAKGK